MQRVCGEAKLLLVSASSALDDRIHGEKQLTISEESDFYELGFNKYFGNDETKGRNQVDERRSGASVVPRVPHEPRGLGQHRWRIHGASRNLEAQFVAVVRQIANLEHKRDEVEGQKDHAGAHEADEEVELQVGLFPFRPRQGQVEEKPRHALVHDKGLEKDHKEAVPDGPQVVAVDVAAPPFAVGGHPAHRVARPQRGPLDGVQVNGRHFTLKYNIFNEESLIQNL